MFELGFGLKDCVEHSVWNRCAEHCVCGYCVNTLFENTFSNTLRTNAVKSPIYPAHCSREKTLKGGENRMSDYLNSRDDQALEQLIKRSEAAEKLTAQQQENLDAARRILAERSAANVATHFDIPRAISFLTSVC